MSDWALIKIEHRTTKNHISGSAPGGWEEKPFVETGYVNPFEVAAVHEVKGVAVITLRNGKELHVTEKLEELVARIKDAVELAHLSGAHN